MFIYSISGNNLLLIKSSSYLCMSDHLQHGFCGIKKKTYTISYYKYHVFFSNKTIYETAFNTIN